MKVLATLSEARKHLVMPVKTGIQEGMDPRATCPAAGGMACARMTRLSGYNYGIGYLV